MTYPNTMSISSFVGGPSISIIPLVADVVVFVVVVTALVAVVDVWTF